MKSPRLLAVLWVLTFVLPAGATRTQRLSLEEIRDRAAAVLIVEVLGSSAREGKGGMVWTDYRVRVVETLRGAKRKDDLLTLPFAGGRKGRIEVGIAGVPKLADGSRYLIFLDDGEGRPVPAIGWTQGLFLVTQTAVTSLDGDAVMSRNGELVRMRAGGRAPTSGRRLSDPVVTHADGTVASRTSDVTQVRSDSRAATLDDFRTFVARGSR